MQKLEEELSNLLEEKENRFELDSLWGQYSARCIRIAFLQGLKEFYNLCLALREDTEEILRKYIDIEELED